MTIIVTDKHQFRFLFTGITIERCFLFAQNIHNANNTTLISYD
ncbi:hypothetical protein KOCBH_00652 [Klebsiella michiganensis]|nr:hypothetical protein KOCBH_00652 [Klebsiella michiganensis]